MFLMAFLANTLLIHWLIVWAYTFTINDFGCLVLTLMALLCIPRALFTAFHQTVRAVAGKIQSLVAMTTQTFSIFK